LRRAECHLHAQPAAERTLFEGGPRRSVKVRYKVALPELLDELWDIRRSGETAFNAEVPENARLFARESLETKEKQHKTWKA
jgi:hypothetical protein